MAKLKKRNDGLYQKTIILGRKPDGHYLKKTVYGKTRKDLEQKVLELTQQLNSGIQVWESGVTFKELADIWIDQYNPDASERWRYIQQGMLNKHLLPVLGQMKVRDIRQLHLQSIISTLAKDGYATGTMKKVKQTAERIMRVAVGSDLIIKNPFSDVKVPVREPKSRKIGRASCRERV